MLRVTPLAENDLGLTHLTDHPARTFFVQKVHRAAFVDVAKQVPVEPEPDALAQAGRKPARHRERDPWAARSDTRTFTRKKPMG